MKRTALLHAELSRVIATLGHGDMLVLGDAGLPIPDGPLYVTIDLDALDPAFAPGVSHPEPGGLSVRDIVAVLARIRTGVVGADIVELNPVTDHGDATAIVAVKLMKELAGAMARA